MALGAASAGGVGAAGHAENISALVGGMSLQHTMVDHGKEVVAKDAADARYAEHAQHLQFVRETKEGHLLYRATDLSQTSGGGGGGGTWNMTSGANGAAYHGGVAVSNGWRRGKATKHGRHGGHVHKTRDTILTSPIVTSIGKSAVVDGFTATAGSSKESGIRSATFTEDF